MLLKEGQFTSRSLFTSTLHLTFYVASLRGCMTCKLTVMHLRVFKLTFVFPIRYVDSVFVMVFNLTLSASVSRCVLLRDNKNIIFILLFEGTR